MSLCLLISTINRSPLLERSLERLCELTPPDEVLVVDDGGEDGCDNTCSMFADRLPIRYIYTHNPGITICSHARNVGLKNTGCDIIMTSEPECLFVSDVVAQMREVWERTELVTIAGKVHHNDMEPERVTLGWSATYTALWGRREDMLAIGGWDEDFPGVWGFDDIDMLTRMRLAGHNQTVENDIEILHQYHLNTGHSLGASGNGLVENDVYFKGKGLDFGTENLVANRGHEWGVVKAR